MKTTDYFDAMPYASTRYSQTAGGRLYPINSGSDSLTYLGERIVWTLPFMCYGDYSGSAVEESNVRYVEDRYSHLFDAGLLESGRERFGSYMILLVETDMPEDYHIEQLGETLHEQFSDFVETINALESYPVVCEDLWSEVEMERQQEALDNWALDDFVSAVAPWPSRERINDLLTAKQETGETLDLFFKAMERANEYWIDESCGMYIDVDALAQHVTAKDILALK